MKGGLYLARLAQLKLSMTISVLLLSILFALFSVIMVYLFPILVGAVLFRQPLIFSSIDWLIVPLIVGTIIFILIQYLVGPLIVRFSTKLRYLQPGENPWLESIVKELAQKSGLRMPKLAIVSDPTPNAFVFGWASWGATLAVHEGLLKQLNKEEIQGVIGHELGHIKHRDFIVITVLSALPLIAYSIARLTFSTALATDGGTKKEGNWLSEILAQIALRLLLILAAVISYVMYIVTLLCVLRVSRLREYYADSYSAYLTGMPRVLSSALTKITYGLSLSPQPPHGARTFYIGDPAQAKQECAIMLLKKREYDLDQDGVLDEKELELAMEAEARSKWTTINTWFATHPPTYQRILLLREIEKEVQTGRYTNEHIYAHI